MKNWVLGNDQGRMRDSYLWNTISGMINALQSTCILFILMRIGNADLSGLFTLAFANANLMLCIGKYGMRYYQVSDTNNHLDFSAFFTHRLITCLWMLLFSAGFCLFSFFVNGYSAQKAWIFFSMCLLKVIDAVEDVFHGEYQRQGKLDVAGRCLTLRLLTMIVSFVTAFWLWKSLVVSCFASLMISLLVLIYQLHVLKPLVGRIHINTEKGTVSYLMRSCFPLFLSSFLIMFLVNAPRYAIDRHLPLESQAIYGFISMPVFVVGLLAEFIYRPMATTLSNAWSEKRFRDFERSTLKIIGIIFLLTLVCIAGGIVVGLPVLGYLYNCDLSPYNIELALLLAGSGFLAFASFLTMLITIIRAQRTLLWAYVAISLSALPIANLFVKKQALMGASMSYLLIMCTLCLIIAVIIIVKKAQLAKAMRQDEA